MKNSLLVFLSVAIIAISFPSFLYGYDFNFDFQHNMEQDQNDFHVKFQDNLNITNFYTGFMNPFGEADVVQLFGATVVDFDGAIVPQGQMIHIGFDIEGMTDLKKGGDEQEFAAYWTSDGDPTEAVPVGGCRYTYDTLSGDISVFVNNDTGPDTIMIYDFNYFITSTRIPLNSLMWDSIPWTSIPGMFILSTYEVAPPIMIPGVADSDYVVFGWKTIWLGNPLSEVRGIFQERAVRTVLACDATVYSTRVPNSGGTILWDLEVSNNGNTTEDVYGEIYPTVGDCASGTVFDFDINRLIVSSLSPGASYTGYYYYSPGTVTGFSQAAVWTSIGPSIDSWLSSCCFEFFFTYPFGKSEGLPQWNNSGQWLDREDEGIILPEVTSLGQNYPNPFNASTIIPFDLANPGYTSIKIYNLTGQLVETLIDGNMPEGRHATKWDGSTFSSGVYFYELNANGVSMSRKLHLLK